MNLQLENIESWVKLLSVLWRKNKCSSNQMWKTMNDTTRADEWSLFQLPASWTPPKSWLPRRCGSSSSGTRLCRPTASGPTTRSMFRPAGQLLPSSSRVGSRNRWDVFSVPCLLISQAGGSYFLNGWAGPCLLTGSADLQSLANLALGIGLWRFDRSFSV